MPETDEFEGALGLADFLSDLRAELAEASRRAEAEDLKLGVEAVTVSLDVAVTVAKKGEASARASAKFWVFAAAEAGASAEYSTQRAATQHLTLTLKPRVSEVIVDDTGRAHVVHRALDVSGAMASREESPDLPNPKD